MISIEEWRLALLIISMIFLGFSLGVTFITAKQLLKDKYDKKIL